jgi:hypothetical protein
LLNLPLYLFDAHFLQPYRFVDPLATKKFRLFSTTSG